MTQWSGKNVLAKMFQFSGWIGSVGIGALEQDILNIKSKINKLVGKLHKEDLLTKVICYYKHIFDQKLGN